MKVNQNTVIKDKIVVGRDKRGRPIYKDIVVDTTMTRVIISDLAGNKIGEAAVKKAEDFNYNFLFALAKAESGRKLIAGM